jgi:hypothetical protein
MEKKGNIFVATPMYGGQCTGYYTQSMLTLGPVLNQNGYDMAYSAMFNESLIQRGRNALAHGFMQRPECTHLMFIDADIKFNPQDIIKMLEADKDIICGIYPKKEINWVEVEKAVKEGVPTDRLKTRTASVVVNLKDYAGSVTVPVGEPVEIFNGGTGFMLIKRSTFETMKSVVSSYNNDVLFLDGAISNDRITEYFACAIEPGTERLLSEDYFFCWKAREAGLKVWAAPWAQLGHFGSYLFEGGLTPAP